MLGPLLLHLTLLMLAAVLDTRTAGSAQEQTRLRQHTHPRPVPVASGTLSHAVAAPYEMTLAVPRCLVVVVVVVSWCWGCCFAVDVLE